MCWLCWDLLRWVGLLCACVLGRGVWSLARCEIRDVAGTVAKRAFLRGVFCGGRSTRERSEKVESIALYVSCLFLFLALSCNSRYISGTHMPQPQRLWRNTHNAEFNWARVMCVGLVMYHVQSTLLS